MMPRQVAQHAFALRRELEHHLAAINVAGIALHQAVLLAAIHQLNRTVVLNLHSIGNITHSRRLRLGLERKQKLILLRFEAGFTRSLLAEPQETADVETKVRQGTVFRLSQISADLFSISWHDTLSKPVSGPADIFFTSQSAETRLKRVSSMIQKCLMGL